MRRVPAVRRVGAILLAGLLVHQCVPRQDGTDTAHDAAPVPVARPEALTRPRAGLGAVTPATVATVARSLPPVPVTTSPIVGVPPERRDPVAEPAAVSPVILPVHVETARREALAAQDPVSAADGAMVELDATVAAYRDHYLVDDEAGQAIGFQALRSARIGRRFLEAELIYYDTNDDFLGGSTEKGLRTRWRQETLNWGDFDGELIFSDIESDFLGQQFSNDEIYFTLRQSNAPLDNGWLMNNAAGHQRSLIDPFLHSGYRIRLPTSLFLGVSMSLETGMSLGQWYMGKTGDNRGIAVPQFRENGGEIIGGSWRRPLSDEFQFGLEIVDVKGTNLIRDHTSLLAGGRYGRPDGRAQYDLRMLANEDSTFGIWADSRNALWSDLVLRYGAFYLEPELAWMDRPIVNDQYGAYARVDKRTYAYNFSLGYDYTKAGLDSAALFDAEYQSLYANGNYRLTRKLSVGANANVVLREFRSTTDDSQVAWRLSNFVNYRFPTGVGRFELYGSQLTSEFDPNNSDIVGSRVSYDWSMPQGYRLTTELQLEQQRRLNLDNSNQRASVLFRQDIASNFSWGVNTSYYRNDDELLSESTGIGINADARWQFLRDWFVSATLAHNQTTLDSSAVNLIGGDTEIKSDSLWLRIGYANASGQPYRRYGRSTNAAGGGRIHGEVFFDENRDSVRQAGERAAVGVVVVIDGRYEVRTDGQGRYEFDPVYPGPHRVSLITEDLPLPWGLDDESPRSVNVSVRQTETVDFALADLGGL